jgi:hypothetical protein
MQENPFTKKNAPKLKVVKTENKKGFWGKVKETLNTDVPIPFTNNLRIWSKSPKPNILNNQNNYGNVQQGFDQLYNELNPEGKPVSDEEFDQLYNELNPERKPVSDEEFDQLYYELNPEENPALYTLNNASQEENAELLANTDIVKVNPVKTTPLTPKQKP